MFEFFVHVHVKFFNGILHPKCGGWVGACAVKAQDCELSPTHPSYRGRWMSNAYKSKWKTQPCGSCNPNPTKWENCSIDTPFLRRKKICDKWIMDVCAFVSCHLFAVWCFWFWQWCSLNKRFGVDVSWATQIWIRSFSVVYMFYECDNSIRRFWLHRM